jgi:Protein of unknown function (DUF1696).
MGLLNSILGNASEITNAQNELSHVLMLGETVLRGFKIFRDAFVFTSSRLITAMTPDVRHFITEALRGS